MVCPPELIVDVLSPKVRVPEPLGRGWGVPTALLSTRNWIVPVGVVPAMVPPTVTVSGSVLVLTAHSWLVVVTVVVVRPAPMVPPVPVGVALAQFVISIFTSRVPRPVA